MPNSIINIVSDSIFCNPSQLESPGRILVTDCYWTRQFDKCAQLFQIGERYVFIIPFRWAPLFQPILEKIKLGSGLNPESILHLLNDRKTFSGLKIEQVQDIFSNSDWDTCDSVNAREWWRAYPIEYTAWFQWHNFQQVISASTTMGNIGIDARQIKSSAELDDFLSNIDFRNSFHLVLTKTVELESELLKNDELTVVVRQRITWDA